MKDTTILILVFVTLPVSVLISYVLHKVYHKNVPPSIIGMGLVATFISRSPENPLALAGG